MSHIYLKDKNSLFSTDGIAGFKDNIETVLKEIFHHVSYIEGDIPEKKERSIYFKILREANRKLDFKFIKKLFNNLQADYQDRLLDKLNLHYDYFFVVAGREFSSSFIQKLRKRNPGIICILFLWDKFENTSLKFSAHEFDHVFTFDKEDAEKYNFIFRPSFFIDECSKDSLAWNEREHSIFYVGALRDKKRYETISKIDKVLQKTSEKESAFIKLFIDKKSQSHLPKNYNINIITHEKMDYFETIEATKKSKVILDLPHKNQQGLTLRSFESLATKTKIITTNKDIVNYDFFNSENILIIDEKNIEINTDFFEKPYKEIPHNILKKYSAKGFIKSILSSIEK